jgi:hypothetical protein
MKNKIRVNVYIPSVDSEYEILIPANDTIKKVLDLIIKSVNELTDDILTKNDRHYLLDPETSKIYDNAAVVRETGITNSKRIILI